MPGYCRLSWSETLRKAARSSCSETFHLAKTAGQGLETGRQVDTTDRVCHPAPLMMVAPMAAELAPLRHGFTEAATSAVRFLTMPLRLPLPLCKVAGTMDIGMHYEAVS